MQFCGRKSNSSLCFQLYFLSQSDQPAMLSILIPIYNFDVRPLATALELQCRAADTEFEILCFDDGSQENFKQLHRPFFEKKTGNIVYCELPQNLGRSAIRNALGRAARFPWLLFMDCDSFVVRDDYIEKYLAHLQTGSLLYGGRCYAPDPPADLALFFHWKYGRNREQSAPERRSQSPYHSFMTNNFLIPREIFLDILFDESLKQYGHEDTLFGLELAARHIPILHIDNPLEHIGLEPVDIFLEKTKQGLENLYTLWREGKPVQTRLLDFYLKMRKWKLALPLSTFFIFFKKRMETQLRSSSPSLKLFDLYKLGCLLEMESDGSARLISR